MWASTMFEIVTLLQPMTTFSTSSQPRKVTWFPSNSAIKYQKIISKKNIVMGRTLFYWTSNELKHHLSNIQRTQTCSLVGEWWSNSIFFASNEWTSNLIGPSLDLLNYSSNRLEHRFFEHWTNLNVFIFCNQTQTPYFWLRAIEVKTSNMHIRPITTKIRKANTYVQKLCNKHCLLQNTPLILQKILNFLSKMEKHQKMKAHNHNKKVLHLKKW